MIVCRSSIRNTYNSSNSPSHNEAPEVQEQLHVESNMGRKRIEDQYSTNTSSSYQVTPTTRKVLLLNPHPEFISWSSRRWKSIVAKTKQKTWIRTSANPLEVLFIQFFFTLQKYFAPSIPFEQNTICQKIRSERVSIRTTLHWRKHDMDSRFFLFFTGNQS